VREHGHNPTRVRPVVEGLETRLVLSEVTAALTSASVPGRLINRQNGISLSDRRFSYTTPQGTRIIVTLYGVGSLAGSSVNSDGSLNLVYGGTNAGTHITAFASGGDHRAVVRSILPASSTAQSVSGVSSTAIYSVLMSGFVLQDGGQINLTGGVHKLQLYAIGANTQVNLRELPLKPTTTGNSATSTQDGVILSYDLFAGFLATLNDSAGAFNAGEGLTYTDVIDANGVVANGPPAPPPGMVLQIQHVYGPSRSSALPDPQVFGTDPTTNTLIRFDTTTGAALQTIPLPASSAPYGETALARDNGVLVVLVANGSRILAFNALTGSAMGSFDTANLGFATIDGIGSTDARTVIENAASGLAQIIDVTASLGSGQAVALSKPFAPTPPGQYALTGGVTGIAGSNRVFATVSTHFDTFQPNNVQSGIVTLRTTNDQLTGNTPAVLKQGGNFIQAGPALGSVDQDLALVTGVSNGKNTVALFDANLTPDGTFTLDNPNLLSGLSESFRPGLAGAAIIDVQGNIQSYKGIDARGLVLNDIGNLNLVRLHRATDTTIIGEPFGHPDIKVRNNVTILSTKRSKGDANGVTVVPGLRPVGPLQAPLPGLAGVRGPTT